MSQLEISRENNFTSHFSQDRPRIDVVLQATGKHTWNMSEGWVSALESEGLLNRVFRPISDWGALEPSNDDGLYRYLENPQADIILLLGFDWHSQPLHSTSRWQEKWSNAAIKKIAILNEQCSAAPVQQNLHWRQQVFNSLRMSLPVVDGIICNHEPDIEFLKKKILCTKPTIFQPYSIDTNYFSSILPFKDRINRGFFRGRIANFYNSGCYNRRQILVERLQQCEEVYIKEYEESFTIEDYINDLNKYKILINLPSISLTLTARVFEALGCGGTLLQYSILGKKSNTLFKDWEHLVYYDPDNPGDLISKLKYLIKNPDVAEKIARNGSILCHQEHSIKARIAQIVKWVDNEFEEREKSYNSASLAPANKDDEKISEYLTINLPEAKFCPTIVIDGVFFQLNNTGISRVWYSILKEWNSKSNLALNVVVLDRENTAPRFENIKYRDLPAYSYNETGLDSQILQAACDEAKADLFISTYYTTPITTPSVFMAYDMVPEVIEANLKEPMWREKHLGIRHACQYLAISQNTADDLIRFFPEILSESVNVAHCGIDQELFFPSSAEKIINFRLKHSIQKPYFLIVGSRIGCDGYKNALLFFKAFQNLPEPDKFSIVCVGGKPDLEPELSGLVYQNHVHLLRLEDPELSVAYSGAIALVYPSLYEGFGLPIAEAMACGCPVITCRNSSIPEVAGEAAIYVDEYKVEEMVEALGKVQIPEVRKLLIEQGLEQSKKFSWEKMADTIANCIQKTAKHLKQERQTSSTSIWEEFRTIQSQYQRALLSKSVCDQENKSLTQDTEIRSYAIEHSQETSNQDDFASCTISVNSEALMNQEIYQLSEQIQQKQQQLAVANTELLSIKSSKAWKLRTAWFSFKQVFLPLSSLIVGLSLIILVNLIYTYPPISNIVSGLYSLHDKFWSCSGINLIAISLILGIVGNLGFIDSQKLRIIRSIIVILGLIMLVINQIYSLS
jgi:glycosyltransferase involved in cell wall biosynthesis